MPQAAHFRNVGLDSEHLSVREFAPECLVLLSRCCASPLVEEPADAQQQLHLSAIVSLTKRSGLGQNPLALLQPLLDTGTAGDNAWGVSALEGITLKETRS